MYWAAVLCLLSKHASTSSNPASCISASKCGYYQLLSRNRRGCLPMIHMDTLCLTPNGPAHTGGHHPHLRPNEKYCQHHHLEEHPNQPWIWPPPSQDYQQPRQALPQIIQVPHQLRPIIIWCRHDMNQAIQWFYQVWWYYVGLEVPRRARPHILRQQPTPFPLLPLGALGSGGVLYIKGRSW